MALTQLFRRRQVWVPTLTGWIILLALSGSISVLAGYLAYPFLAPDSPTAGAQVLVVEGWLDVRELDQAIAVVRQGKYDHVATTGAPVDRWTELSARPTYADLAASYLKTHGLNNLPVTPVPSPASAQDRTYLSAVKLRDWTKKQGITLRAVDVFSSGTHARRSQMLFQMAFGPSVDVGILSAVPSQYDEKRWWRTSSGIKSVLSEAIGVAWTVCCFYPPPQGSHEELWALPRRNS
jgi:hypothetical protein